MRFARPSVPYVLVTREQKKCRKIKIDVNVLHGTSANFQLKRSKVKFIRRQEPQELSAYLVCVVADQMRAA